MLHSGSLLAEPISETFITAFELPYIRKQQIAGYFLSLVVDIKAEIQGQSGQQFKTTSSEVTSKVMDNQMTTEWQWF